MKKTAPSGPATLDAPMPGAMNLPWKRVLDLARPIRLPANAPLVLLDDELDDFYYLASGKLRLMHSAEDGVERTILYIGPGTLFNESTVLVGYDAPGCAFFCLEDSVIHRFPGRLLHDQAFVAAHPDLIINLMTSQAVKILMMHVGLSNTVGNTPRRRICRLISSMAKRHGGALEFDPCMTQYDMATLLGLHRASVVRALGELRRLGAVSKFTKHTLRIENMDLLLRLSRE